MKIVLALLTLTVASSALAAKCNISAGIKPRHQMCATYTTKFTVDTEQECRELAFGIPSNRFFGVLDQGDIVLSAKYTFKDEGRKVKDKITFEDSEEYCF